MVEDPHQFLSKRVQPLGPFRRRQKSLSRQLLPPLSQWFQAEASSKPLHPHLNQLNQLNQLRSRTATVSPTLLTLEATSSASSLVVDGRVRLLHQARCNRLLHQYHQVNHPADSKVLSL